MTFRLLLSLAACAWIASPALGAESEPTTASQAADLIDLHRVQLPPNAVLTGWRRAASLRFTTSDSAEQAFKWMDAQLSGHGWKQEPGGVQSGASYSVYYRHGSHLASVSASPGGERGVIASIRLLGNISPAELPLPSELTSAYSFPHITMYTTDQTPEAASAAIAQSMTAAGWAPYGDAGQTSSFRRNAVQADITVQAAPGQGGSTMVSCSTLMLSLEIPAPEFAQDLRYTDGTTDLQFDCERPANDVHGYYRKALKARGWSATTDNPVEARWKLATVFRNSDQEMLTLETHDFEGRTRVKIDHSNCGEVAEEAFRHSREAGRRASHAKGGLKSVEAPSAGLPKPTRPHPWALRYDTAEGEAFAGASRLVSALGASGWEIQRDLGDYPHIRQATLLHGEQRIQVVAVDSPQGASWIGVAGVGVRF